MFVDLEALGEKRGQQQLQAHQVLELEVPNGGLAFDELLDELFEAITDSLASEEVVRSDVVLHVLWQEGLVAVSENKSACQLNDPSKLATSVALCCVIKHHIS